MFEADERCGKKILATGNGRCNISNQKLEPSQYNHEKFVQTLLGKFGLDDTIEFFDSIGLQFVVDKKPDRLYPRSLQAHSVVKLLLFELEKLSVEIKYDTTIKNIKQKKDVFTLSSSRLVSYKFDKVVLATGSLAHSLGKDIGYKIARNLSHNIIEPTPSLVGLISQNIYCPVLAGVKICTAVSLVVDDIAIQTIYGDLLFARYGLSGSAVLELSRYLPRDKSKTIYISIDLFGDMTTDELSRLLEDRSKIFVDKPRGQLLTGLVNDKFMELIGEKDSYSVMANKLKNITFEILDTREFKYAEVCRGGVDIGDIDHDTLQSKKTKELYFCGEILDIDGNCGGYNLQFAWSSGAVVAQSL